MSKGWKNQSYEHKLASYGITSKGKPYKTKSQRELEKLEAWSEATKRENVENVPPPLTNRDKKILLEIEKVKRARERRKKIEQWELSLIFEEEENERKKKKRI